MAEYILSQEAEDDLLDIALYGFQHHGKRKVIKYRDALEERFNSIASFPLMYTPVDRIREGYRRSVIGEHSIYYRIESRDLVKIIRIIRSQDPF